MLNCVDSWSLFCFTRPLRTKSTEEVSTAFDTIISSNDGVSPLSVYTDAGTKKDNDICNCSKELVHKLKINVLMFLNIIRNGAELFKSL